MHLKARISSINMGSARLVVVGLCLGASGVYGGCGSVAAQGCAATLEIRDQFVESLRAGALGNWGEAERRLEQVLLACPEHTEARMTLAGWYLDDGRAADARSVLKGVDRDQRSASSHLLWARLELANSDFSAARTAAENALAPACRANRKEKRQAEALLRQTQRAQVAALAPPAWTVSPLWQANSPASEHSPLWDARSQQLYLTSRRGATASGEIDSDAHIALAPDGQPWEAIYTLQFEQSPALNEQSAPQHNPTLALEGLAFGHQATVTLGADGHEMLLFSGAQERADGQLSSVAWTENGWGTCEQLPRTVNSRWPEYGAAFSPDGQTLYFSSERPGGFGGRDLYKVQRLPNGSWSKAVILDGTINTAGDEDAPFIEASGNRLFFSSTSHGSVGGYDIFSVAFANGRVESVGTPMNGPCDDTHYHATAQGQVFFTSNRPGGAGRSDIYSAQPKAPALDRQLYTGVFQGADGKPALVKLVLNARNGSEKTYKARASDGQFLLALNPDQAHSLSVQLNGKEVYTLELGQTAHTRSPQRLGRIALEPRTATIKSGRP